MPLNHRSAKPVVFRQNKPSQPSCRGGVSSMLRVKPAERQRLPSTEELSTWMSHAASVLMPVTEPHFDFAEPNQHHTAGT